MKLCKNTLHTSTMVLTFCVLILQETPSNTMLVLTEQICIVYPCCEGKKFIVER